jgi:hypothetical protein
MTIKPVIFLSLGLLALAPLAGHAEDTGEDTMTVLQAGEGPEGVINLITLPRPGQPSGTGAGEDTAELARDGGSTFGRQVADEAQQAGRQFGADVSGMARELADEAAGRGISEQIREELQQDARRGPPEGAVPEGVPGRPD